MIGGWPFNKGKGSLKCKVFRLGTVGENTSGIGVWKRESLSEGNLGEPYKGGTWGSYISERLDQQHGGPTPSKSSSRRFKLLFEYIPQLQLSWTIPVAIISSGAISRIFSDIGQAKPC